VGDLITAKVFDRLGRARENREATTPSAQDLGYFPDHRNHRRERPHPALGLRARTTPADVLRRIRQLAAAGPGVGWKIERFEDCV
jgi:hypothetical protein